ncbi:MAG: hypothetical protein GTN78_18480, partial [Gemmatimonadales bacterium]|nr:hypothetical protein [Gemmatimonadales bacterium]
MRVVGDRFYFIDAVVDTIKQYRSPGVFVWESKILENAHFLDVAPDGKVYAVWGAAVDQLSCIDSKGKLLWTKQAREVVPR